LNRAILEQGWSGFATMLAYKLDERGGTLTLAPASYSSQECFSCGTIDAQNRKSQAVLSASPVGIKTMPTETRKRFSNGVGTLALLDVGRHSLPLEASIRKAAA
jgi:putative transposase